MHTHQHTHTHTRMHAHTVAKPSTAIQNIVKYILPPANQHRDTFVSISVLKSSKTEHQFLRSPLYNWVTRVMWFLLNDTHMQQLLCQLVWLTYRVNQFCVHFRVSHDTYCTVHTDRSVKFQVGLQVHSIPIRSPVKPVVLRIHKFLQHLYKKCNPFMFTFITWTEFQKNSLLVHYVAHFLVMLVLSFICYS